MSSSGYDNLANAIEKFVENEKELDSLAQWVRKINVFDILGISRAEIRHSAILKWLLDTTGNHGLGDKFVREFVRRIIRNNEDKKYDAEEWEGLDYRLSELEIEKQIDRDKRLDIFVHIKKSEGQEKEHILVIENKVDSSEGYKQTEKYRDQLDIDYPSEKFGKMLVFLTVRKDLPEDSQNWSTMSYSDVYSILEAIQQREDWKDIPEDAKTIIREYSDTVNGFYDNEDAYKLCQEIYAKYHDVFDEIKKNGVDWSEELKDLYKRKKQEIDFIIKNGDSVYKAFADNFAEMLERKNESICLEPELRNKNKYYIRFYSHTLDRYFIQNEIPNGSWKTKRNYYYEMEVKGLSAIEDTKPKIYARLILGGKNLSDKSREKHSEIEDILKEKKGREEYSYKTIASKTIDMDCDLDVLSDEQINKVVKIANQWIKDIEDKIEEGCKGRGLCP